jgi:uncharacterized membrane protein
VNKARFESFSDGVFAFAITLLVLGFAVPVRGELKWASDAEITRELPKLWPNMIAYTLSFAVIGIMWQNHYALSGRFGTSTASRCSSTCCSSTAQSSSRLRRRRSASTRPRIDRL